MGELPSKSLSFEDAIEAWCLLWEGKFKNRIAAYFDVNGARLYDVWYGKKHVGSRAIALERIAQKNPSLARQAESGVLDPKPKEERQQKREQGDLFDDDNP